jgi:hypothetical protein
MLERINIEEFTSLWNCNKHKHPVIRNQQEFQNQCVQIHVNINWQTQLYNTQSRILVADAWW